jgi:iron complex outermembrane receptor protein
MSSNGGPGPLLAAWADLGERKGYGVRAGFRFGGRAIAEVMAPPPPPMATPIAPPPATQTCADGSVILASDACPVVAEPLPPVPEAQPERG